MRRNEIGNKYGWLVVVKDLPDRKSKRVVLCQCQCGMFVSRWLGMLRATKKRSRVSSCGCARRGAVNKAFKHGMSETKEFTAWIGLLGRCDNKNNSRYASYGGRGVTVCDRWRESFTNFYADMGAKPPGAYSLDRIDNDGNYEPGNCRWATDTQQVYNTRRTAWYGGYTVEQLSNASGIAHKTITCRISRGWTTREAITIPTHPPIRSIQIYREQARRRNPPK